MLFPIEWIMREEVVARMALIIIIRMDDLATNPLSFASLFVKLKGDSILYHTP